MSANLPTHLTPTSLDRRADRAHGRQLSAIERATATDIAIIEAKAQIESTRLHAAAFVTSQGIQAMGIVNKVEEQLSLMAATPRQIARLQAAADAGAVAIVSQLHDLDRRLR